MRDVEPHLAERAVNERLVGRAFERGAEREHREVRLSCTRLREADGHLALEVIAIEPAMVWSCSSSSALRPLAACSFGQLFACGDERRRQRNGPLERRGRGLVLVFVAPAHPKQVIGVGLLAVEAKHLIENRDGRVRIARDVVGEGELIADARRSVVESQIADIRVSRLRIAAQLVEDVAQLFERPGRGVIECDRCAGNLVRPGPGRHDRPAADTFPTAQMGQHGIGPERNRAAYASMAPNVCSSFSAASPRARATGSSRSWATAR